eukprot:TRINITY_DN6673_c0_g4_i1.p1 TRINITY_DN6673_c0_g4~~TRINITY_DN6673_c0_g4_i1.p1  ORF type:complete len:1820 (+),score=585.09 TRINITY_DN6673_c0_g4_i1:93-5462(+)
MAEGIDPAFQPFDYLLPGPPRKDDDTPDAGGDGGRRYSYISAAESSESNVSIIVGYWSSCRNRVRIFVFGQPWFERFWLLVIVLNCLVLSMEDPTDKDCVTDRCRVTKICDYVFTNLFVLEMAIKMIAYGVYKRKDAYLRDGWNIMDCIIVITGFLAFALEVFFGVDGPVLSSLRAFRLLRPLKAVQSFPAVQLLIAAIIGSLPQLMNVFLLYFFFLIVMGIVSVQLWRGLFGFRCVAEESVALMRAAGLDPADAGYNLTFTDDERICAINAKNRSAPAAFADFGGHLCPWGSTCIEYGGNPHYGFLSFDSIVSSSLTLFVALTLEGWTETMYHTIDATTLAASLFWIVLVVLGSFFILNLTIVIITEAFEGRQRDMREDVFRKMDKDGGGELEKDEVRHLLGKIGYELTDANLDKIFSQMDLDGGGTVSLDEFLVFCQANSAAMGRLITRKGGVTSFMTDIRKIVKACCPCCLTLMDKVRNEMRDYEEKPRGYIAHCLYEIVEPTGTDTSMPRANRIFQHTVIVVIVLNTIALALEWHDQDPELIKWLHRSNNIFTIIFIIEMVMKLVGLGFRGYFIVTPSNNFDFAISLLSLIELLGVGQNVSVFRTFRVLRVVRLTKQVPLLQRWLAILISSIKSAALLTALLFLIVFIVALLGMQLFGGSFCHLDEDWDPDAPGLTATELGTGRGCGGVPRSNYDTLSAALLTSFQILTGEDWNVVMYNGMRAIGSWVALYFVLFYMIGNYMMLNLFIAVLLSNRDLKAENAADDELVPLPSQKGPVEGTDDDGGDDELPPKRRFYTPYVEREWSLFLIPPENVLRAKLTYVVNHIAFEIGVLAAILVSTVCLAIESPMRPEDHPTERVLEQVNYIMVWVFLCEAVVKIVAYGFFLHPTSYLRSEGWNQLDFVIVCISLLALIPGADGIAFLKLLRTLRPLRFINKSEGMKVVVRALIKSIKPLMNVMVISGLIWLIFAIFGMQVFSGKFYRCSVDSYGDMEEESPPIFTKAECLNTTLCPGVDGRPCRWETFSSNFDNLGSSFLTLFEMASLEGWVTVMELGIDGVSHEEAPRFEAHPFYSWYFVIFIVFGSWFLMNLFISVLIDAYYAEKENADSEGSCTLTSAQKKWVTHHKLMLAILSHEPDIDPEWEQRFGISNQSWLNRFCQSSTLDMFIMMCIVVNIVLMATEHYPQPQAWTDVLKMADYIFLGIFVIEAAMKIANFRKWYFKDAWNRFDFIIVVLSLAGLAIEIMFDAGVAVSVFRVLRLSRLLRMVKQAEGIQRILKTLVLSLPSLINVAGIVGLLFFIYAVLGVKLFSGLDRDNPNNDLGPYANFENFYIATLLLIRMTTGEAWQSILDAARAEPPHCDEQLATCGLPYISGIYFCSFTLAGMYVLLNLFIAIILDTFSEAGSDEVCSEEYLGKVKNCWQKRMHVITIPDFIQTSGIKKDELEGFLQEIGPPLGFPTFLPLSQRAAFIERLEIVPDLLTGVLTEGEMFPKLFKARYGIDLPEMRAKKLAADEEKLASPTKALQATAMSILRIQAMVRGHLARKRMRKQGLAPDGTPLPGGPADPTARLPNPLHPVPQPQPQPLTPQKWCGSERSAGSLRRQYPLRPPPALSPSNASALTASDTCAVEPAYHHLKSGAAVPMIQRAVLSPGLGTPRHSQTHTPRNGVPGFGSATFGTPHGIEAGPLAPGQGNGAARSYVSVNLRAETPEHPRRGYAAASGSMGSALAQLAPHRASPSPTTPHIDGLGGGHTAPPKRHHTERHHTEAQRLRQSGHVHRTGGSPIITI